MINTIQKIAVLPSVLMFFSFSSLHAEALVTDRPDATESSSVVAPHFFQYEVGATAFEDGEGVDGLESFGSLLRVGVRENLELRFGWGGYLDSDTESGVNDAMFGLKYYLAPEDGLRPEAAILVHVSLPIGDTELSSDALDPDFLLSFSHTLSEQLSIGYNLGGKVETSERANGNETTLSSAVYSVALGYSISDQLGAYAEVFGSIGLSADESPASFDAGLTWLINDDQQIDCFVGTGLNNDADKWMAGIGYSIRWPSSRN